MARHCSLLLLIVLLALSGVACREAQMAAPADLAPSIPAWKVQQTRIIGWDSPFTFGPYMVKDVKRGWTESTAWGFMVYESYRADQSFEYIVENKAVGAVWRCNCATNVNQQVLEGMVGPGKLTWELGAGQSLACSLRAPSGKIWRMALAASGASNMPMQGALETSGFSVLIKGTDKLEGSPIPLSEPTGYVFSSIQGTVGAVQVINNGVLWLPNSAQQPALAAAAAGLLLYQDISRK